ncbi:MAG: sulfur carrier protein [Desulforhopalus sp.]|jgi:sulfur carrier protein
MKILINGQQEEIEQWTINQLVENRQLQAGSLVVELNREIIKQTEWKDVQLKDGDQLELLSFVGGG